MRRTRLTLVSVAALALFIGCDDDDDDDMDAGRDAGEVEVDSGPEPDAGPTPDAGPEPDASIDAGDGDDAGGGGGAAPTITRVRWQAAPGCDALTPSDVDIIVTAVDTDTPAPMLTFSGSATGCTGAIDAAMSTVECPNAAPYPSSVTVTDPEGNSDTASFTFGPCDTGMADF